MKLKFIAIASLILFILTISAVSASQDIIDDNLTADEITEDSINESVVDEIISTEENNEELSDVQLSDFKVNVTKEINTSEENWEEKTLVSVYCSEDINGVQIFIAEPGTNQSLEEENTIEINIPAGNTVNLTCNGFYYTFKHNLGNFDVVVTYNDTEISRETLKVTRIIYPDEFHDQFFDNDYQYDDSNVIILTPFISGNLTVYVNGNPRYNKHFNQSSLGKQIYVNKTELGLTIGENNISAKYITDDYGTVDFGEYGYLSGEEYVKYIPPKIDLAYLESPPGYNPMMPYPVAIIKDPENITGTIKITIDGKEVYNKSFTGNKTEMMIGISELDYDGVIHGTNSINVTYSKNDVEEHSLERSIIIYESPNIYIPDFMFEGEKEGIIINANKKYTGIITVYKSYMGRNKELFASTRLINGFARVSLENLTSGQYDIQFDLPIDQLDGMDLGKLGHMVTVKDNPSGYECNISATKILTGESVTVTLKGANVTNDTVFLVVDGVKYKNITFNNGTATSIIKDLSVGEHYITTILRTEIFVWGTDQYSNTFVVNVVNPIDPDLKITVTSVHKSEKPVITIKTATSFTGKVNVKIGSKNYVVNVVKGKGTKTLSGLKIGTYTATAKFAATGFFKSATKSAKFKVKADVVKLTLKKIKVKKSAKKLKITATLKINGKMVKGKLLKFKFNKQTYKSKTNKKGVAKITIKKKVLKKLKVGKKVKYQVSYGKKTVKKSVKVKK